MIPLAGSAYTYAYATLGELLAWIIGWDLTLEYAMGASTVSSGWSNHFIELLNIFNIKMPLWLAYDHWTALKTAENIVARQMATASDASLVPGTAASWTGWGRSCRRNPPELVQRAQVLLDAPTIFGVADRVQPAGVHYCAGDHGDSGRRNQGERALQRHHRGDQGSGGAVRDRDGYPVREHRATGVTTGRRSRRTDSPVSAPAQPTSSSRISASTRSRRPRRRPRTRSAICRSGSSFRWSSARVLYILVAGVLTGMVPWREINIEAPIARAFLDRGLTTASHVITRRRAGRPHQRDAGHAARPDSRVVLDGERRPAAAQVLRRHPPEVPHARGRTRSWSGFLPLSSAASRQSTTSARWSTSGRCWHS